MKKKGFILALILVLCLFCIKVHALSTYYFISSNSYDGFELSKDNFKDAKKNCQKITEEFNSELNLESNKIYIFHFETASAGYYSFYTIGNVDTIISLYEEENTLWLADYKFVDKSDNEGTYLSSPKNAGIHANLEGWEDFYVAIRSRDDDFGTIKLIFEPNEDKLDSSLYGYNEWVISNVDNSLQNLGICTDRIQYFSKTDLILLYWLNDPAHYEALNELQRLFNEDEEQGTNKAIDILNGILEEPISEKEYVKGLGMSVLKIVIKAVVKQTFIMINEPDTMTRNELQDYLVR